MFGLDSGNAGGGGLTQGAAGVGGTGKGASGAANLFGDQSITFGSYGGSGLAWLPLLIVAAVIAVLALFIWRRNK